MVKKLKSLDLVIFNLKDKPARPGRNPRTGEDVEITARRVVTFKSGQKLKEKVKSIDK